MPSNWQWYAGTNEEIFTEGPFDTRDEAEYAAVHELDGGFIVEALKANVQLADHIDIFHMLEAAEDSVSDLQGEGQQVLFDISSEDVNRLEFEIHQAITVWQKKAGIVFTPWCFTSQRNMEYIHGPS
jgi:hypothetical protein